MIFQVEDRYELRSDNPNFCGYRVSLDTKIYILYYDKDQLREVYFIDWFKNYFMSCRTDFKTISHYYIEYFEPHCKALGCIKRYEQGVHNQIYLMESCSVTSCTVNGIPRVYTVINETPKVDQNKLKVDLLAFLKQFYNLGLDKQFSPELF